MKKIKLILFSLFLFFLFLIWNLILTPLNLDEVWNYGFAHNIYSGLVPYRDFNLVITPFFPFLMSIPFHIFGSSMLVFHIFHSIMLVLISLLLFKMFDDRAWIVLTFFFFPLPYIFPSYNMFLFFLLVILIYLETNKKSDYLIGIVLALAVLTKQTVGFCLLLPSLYYLKDLNKIGKRFISFIIMMLPFVVYLFVTESMSSFMDLCVFGLLDFASQNSKFNIYLVLSLIIVIITLIFIYKDKSNINNYYALAFYSILLPIFDIYHFQVAFLAFIMIVLFKVNKNYIKPILFSLGTIFGLYIVMIGLLLGQKEFIYPNKFNHFQYRYLNPDSIRFTNEVNDFINKNKKHEIIHLNSDGYYFRIINNESIGYLDLINRGNWGYNGSDKLLNEIKKKNNAIFLVNKSDLSPIRQTDSRVLRYVIDNGNKVSSIRIYDVYVLNENLIKDIKK